MLHNTEEITDELRENKDVEEEQKELLPGEDAPEYRTATERPYNPHQIRITREAKSMSNLINRIADGRIVMDPEFQRESDLWTDSKMSRLIESILIRIPIPAFYFDATDDDNWIVVDGLQRLSTLRKFVVNKELRLTGLQYLGEEINNRTFGQLPRNLQRRIEETEVIVYLIEPGTPPEVRYHIFERINTGGLLLSPQEIRHALNQGPATTFVKELAKMPEFIQATSGKVKTKRMEDRDFATRFLAFAVEGYENYKPDLDWFMSELMRKLNKMPEDELKRWRGIFQDTMRTAFAIFGDDAFRRRKNLADRYRPISKALFEVWSASLARVGAEKRIVLVKRKEKLRNKFIELMNNPAFERSISQGTSEPYSVKVRHEEINGIIQKILTEEQQHD